MTIQEVQDSITEEFSAFDDWMDRYNLLIDLGRDVPSIDTKFKTKEFLIEGCQSKVWLYPEFKDGKVVFTADSDAIITKGIVGLLIRVLSGRTPDEILSADLNFIDKIGLRQNLSPTRSNGLLSMIRQMKLYAMAYKATAGRKG
jgi:cysteine desulfuration protein SufE